MINQIELLIFSQYYYQYFIWYKIFNLKILKINPVYNINRNIIQKVI